MAKPERIKPRHETVLDITAEQIAHVYAQAFLAVANKTANVAGCVEELQSLVTDVLNNFPDLEEVFRSGLIAHDHKEQVIDEVLGGRASAEVINFLKVLARHGRLGLVRPVVQHLAKLYGQQQGQTDVEIRVAAEPGAALLKEIADGLGRTLGIKPVMDVKVDPELIGGMVVRVGDRVYDGSLSTQFDLARKAMIERARNRIDTRPEDFLRSAE